MISEIKADENRKAFRDKLWKAKFDTIQLKHCNRCDSKTNHKPVKEWDKVLWICETCNDINYSEERK